MILFTDQGVSFFIFRVWKVEVYFGSESFLKEDFWSKGRIFLILFTDQGVYFFYISCVESGSLFW